MNTLSTGTSGLGGALVVLIPVDLVREGASPVSCDRDSYIFEHLVRYCSTLPELPAVTVKIEHDVAFVARGQVYVAVAKNLGRPKLHAVVSTLSSESEVEAFMKRTGVERLDWASIQAEENSDLSPRGSQVQFARIVALEERKPPTRAGAKLSIKGFRTLRDRTGAVVGYRSRPLPLLITGTYRPRERACIVCGAVRRRAVA